MSEQAPLPEPEQEAAASEAERFTRVKSAAGKAGRIGLALALVASSKLPSVGERESAETDIIPAPTEQPVYGAGLDAGEEVVSEYGTGNFTVTGEERAEVTNVDVDTEIIELDITKDLKPLELKVLMDYGEDFETSEEDAKRALFEMVDFVDENSEIWENPQNIKKIKIRGFASSENLDANGEDTDESEDNERLATARAELLENALRLVLNERDIEFPEGVEVTTSEDTLDEDAEKAGMGIAERLGYENVTELTNALNAGEVDDEDAQEWHETNRANERGAEISVIASVNDKVQVKKTSITAKGIHSFTTVSMGDLIGYIPKQETVERKDFVTKVDHKVRNTGSDREHGKQRNDIRQQTREHNMHKRRGGSNGGKIERNKGGGRRSKRG